MNDLYGLLTGGYNPFGGLGFAPMSQSSLGMMGISNPYAAAFRTPSYDQPILPFGAAPMPAYGYQMQQGLLPQQQPQQPQQPQNPAQQVTPGAIQKQLFDAGALVRNPAYSTPFMQSLRRKLGGEVPMNTIFGRSEYITPYQLYQQQYLGDGGG